MKTRFFIVMTFALSLSQIIFAQITSLNRIGQTPGGAGYHVNWDESSKRLIVGCGAALWIYDMTNPASPVIIGKRPLLGLISETILLNNNVLFVAASFDGVYAIDISSSAFTILAHKILDGPSVRRAAYDMVLHGDTLYVAYGNDIYGGGVARLKYTNGIGFTQLNDVGPANDVICIASNNKFFAIGQIGLVNGKVLLYNNNNLNTPIATWQDSTIKSLTKLKFADLNDSIIYVCGGSSNSGATSHFQVLKFTGTSLVKIDSYHINGIPLFAAANIQNLDSRNDTIYIATGCAINQAMGAPLSFIPVFDASGLPDIPMTMIEYFNAGLWHFDVALMQGTPYMATASEWLGVAINNITGGNPLDTLILLKTGGWTQKSLAKGDTLFVAHEGWGLAAYRIDSLKFTYGFMTKPQILHIYEQSANDQIFVSDFEFLNDTLIFLSSGHLFNLKPWLLGGQPELVYKINLQGVVSVKKIQTNLGVRIVVGKEIPLLNISSLTIIDPFNTNSNNLFTLNVFNNPKSIQVVNDSLLLYGGKIGSTLYLIASKVRNDSIIPIATTQLSPSFHALHSIAVENDLVVAARGNRLHLFHWDGMGFVQLPDYVDPKMIALGLELKNNLLYIADKTRGLIILDVSNPQSPVLVAESKCRGGFRNLHGTESVTLGKNGEIFLSDFHTGVIIIEPFDLTFSVGKESNNLAENFLWIYPNPANNHFSVEIENLELNESTFICIFDMTGRVIKKEKVLHEKLIISVDNWPKGVYIVYLIKDKKIISGSKIIIH